MSALYKYRFQVFLLTLLLLLFGTLIIPGDVLDNYLKPFFILANLIAGLILISKIKRVILITAFVLFAALVVFSTAVLFGMQGAKWVNYGQMVSYFGFYIIISFSIIRQLWRADSVNNKFIFGLIGGYLSLGMIGFFISVSVEIVQPGSYLLRDAIITSSELSDNLIYFSFITLMTVGYGDISPVTTLAQQSSVVIGLLGQFYLVIITGIVVGKFINQSNNIENEKSKEH